MRHSSENTTSSVRQIFAGVAAFAVMVAVLLSPFAVMIAEAALLTPTTTVIVQFKEDPGAVWQAKLKKTGRTGDRGLAQYRAGLKAKHEQFLASLASRGINYEVAAVDVPGFDGTNLGRVEMRYTLVLNGMAIKVPSSKINTIRSMPQVKSVEQDRKLHVELEKSVDYVRAPQVYGRFKELTPYDSFNEGYEGQGINVAVLDTGIDWTHPMFGGDPTPPRMGLLPSIAAVASNPKVIYYMTFTGGLLDGFGHGTAAASNIGGYLGMAPGPDGIPTTLDDIRLHGVAPQVKLMGYKVCVDVGSCVNSSTIMAIEDAVSPTTLNLQPKPVAHVINMSLGGSGGPDDSTAVAGDNAALMGTIVVASAGNDGPGEATVGSPAAGRHVIAVGANTDPAGGSNTIDEVGGGKSGIIANLLDGAAAVTSDITKNYVYCGLAETPADCPASVNGKIALIARGSTYNLPELPAVGSLGTGLFSNKAASAAANGAVAAVIYNNVDGELTAATVRKSTIPVVGISKANGEYLLAQMAGAEVSSGQIKINAAKSFTPGMADFSSRGPVQGLGQVKPDVTAPGVGVLSATVRVGTADANTATMFDPTGYIPASGTSFSGPHVAGAAALIKQAHLDWSPDMVRTAMINTATSLRSASGAVTGTDSIIAQGGGLIDINGAVNTKALMGVAGDGIIQPGILGSYSFGEMPIVNNRIVNTREVTVTIKDVSGQGGTYSLSTRNNRNFDRDGITASVPASVTVPANGTATFTASVTLDGSKVRDEDGLDLQWYVVATSGGKSIHMPMFLRATPSLPDSTAGGGSSTTETYEGTVLASDGGAQHDTGNYLAEGVTYNDVPFTVGADTVKIDGTLTFTDTAGLEFGLSDLDLYLVGPDGAVIGGSAISGGPEHYSTPVSQAGEYKWRVYGWLGADVPYTLTSTQTAGGGSVTLDPIAANFTEGSTGKRYDFDGSFDVTWTGGSGAEAFDVEQSSDGTTWTTIQQLPGSAQGISFTSLPEGTYNFRLRSVVPGKIGKFVTAPSNAVSITVSRRSEVDATASIEALNRGISFPAGSTELVTALKNTSATTFYPNVRFEITSITGSGVTVSNADNGGNGTTSVATFDYSQLVGEDFISGEESGNKTLKFSNPNNSLFTFTARVTANVPTAGGATAASGESTSAGETATSEGTSTTASPTAKRGSVSKTLKFTVDPNTGSVNVQMVR